MLFEVVTIDLHYMTERQERFDLKMSKLKIKSSDAKASKCHLKFSLLSYFYQTCIFKFSNFT